ncbi:MAG TPA: hypothetical protein VFT22_28865 [Kofleriaceae bacterium]|nr:hypothetical protein [Kofleriaceae bacterium]
MLKLESHPVFSMMQRDVQTLSDGSALIHHLRCVGYHRPDRVRTFGGNNWAVSTIDHGGDNTVCCDRQFVVRDGVVDVYRQVPTMGGTCTAEAVFYPDGHRPADL